VGLIFCINLSSRIMGWVMAFYSSLAAIETFKSTSMLVTTPFYFLVNIRKNKALLRVLPSCTPRTDMRYTEPIGRLPTPTPQHSGDLHEIRP